MYLKFETRLEFSELARMLCPELTEDKLDWDYENVYEWMYIDLTQLNFSLNVSREHGWGYIDDETLNQHQDDQESLNQIVNPGAVYVFGWDRNKSDYIDQLPDYLPAFIADRLVVDVSVFNQPINADIPDEQPVTVVSPKHKIGN
jgi:hypothetical protein